MNDSPTDETIVEELRRAGILEGEISEAQADVINELSREEVETLSNIVGRVKAAGGVRGPRPLFI